MRTTRTEQLAPQPASRLVRVRRRLRWVKRLWRRFRPGARMPAAAGDPMVVARAGDRVKITVGSVGALRRDMPTVDMSVTARELQLAVRAWQSPWIGWSGRLGPLSGLLAHSVQLPRGGSGRVAVTVALAQPVPVPTILVAMLRVLEPARPLPAVLRPEVTVSAARPPWLPADAGTGSRVGVRSNPNLKPDDLVLVAAVSATAVTGSNGRGVCGHRYGLGERPDGRPILIDTATANPRGRQPPADQVAGTVSLSVNGGQPRWRIDALHGDRLLASGDVAAPLDGRQAAALARVGMATFPGLTGDLTPAAYAAGLVQLAMTGVVLDVPDPQPPVAALLAPELVRTLAAPLPAIGAEPVEWEIRSVAQRRAALRGHGSELAAAWPQAARPSLPSVSALLLTRRPDAIADAVAMLSAQTYPHLEVVLGVHGSGLDGSARAALDLTRLPITVRELSGDLSFGQALAEVTRAASGDFVTKVDDDDRYGPEHIWDLVLARQFSGATVTGKAAEFVYLEPRDSTIRRRMGGGEMFTDVVAGGAMLISMGDLTEIGGWRPVAHSVDRALLDRVLVAGGLIYRTHPFGFVYCRHSRGHTWDPGIEYFLRGQEQSWPGQPPFSEFA